MGSDRERTMASEWRKEMPPIAHTHYADAPENSNLTLAHTTYIFGSNLSHCPIKNHKI